MLESRRFVVALNGRKGRWRRQRNGLSQGSTCTGTDVVQHLHQRPARTRRHSQLHRSTRKVYTPHKLNPALHDCCRIISGCLKPTNLDSHCSSVHLLADIAPAHIRRTVVCIWNAHAKRQKQDTNYSITNQLLAD